MYKPQEKPSALKRKHPALQKIKFINFFSMFVGHFYPPGSGSTALLERLEIRENLNDEVTYLRGSPRCPTCPTW
jgi:hypothetical protein